MSGSLPLDESHLQAANALLEIERTAMPVLEKCKACGVPVDNEIDTIRERAEFARKVKSHFFPDQP